MKGSSTGPATLGDLVKGSSTGPTTLGDLVKASSTRPTTLGDLVRSAGVAKQQENGGADLSVLLCRRTDTIKTDFGSESLDSLAKRMTNFSKPDYPSIPASSVINTPPNKPISRAGVVLCRQAQAGSLSQKLVSKVTSQLKDKYFTEPRFNFSTPSPDEYILTTQSIAFREVPEKQTS